MVCSPPPPFDLFSHSLLYFFTETGIEVRDIIARGSTANVKPSVQWEKRKTSTFKVVGRHVFNLWRLMRSERALTSYTLENVVFHTLKKR
jgi:DNA polymerase zeta